MRRHFTSRPFVSASLLGSILFAIGAASGGCSFIVDTSTAQCNIDADCTAKGPAFAGHVCLPDKNVCVLSKDYCTTNAQCIDANGPYWQCDKVKNGCFNLTSAACPTVFAGPDDLRNDNVVVLGFPWLTLNNDELEAAQHAMDLSRQDLVTEGNLPSKEPGGPARPLAWVHCTGGTKLNFEAFSTSVDDLLKLNLPMMTGGLLPDFTNYQAQKTIRAGVFVLGFTGITSSFANIPNRKDFFVASSVNLDTYFRTVAGLIREHEKTLRKERGENARLKLALAVPSDPIFSREAIAYNDVFTINGNKFFDAGGDAILVPLGLDQGGSTQDYVAGLSKIQEFKADIIAVVGQRSGQLPGDYERFTRDNGVTPARFVVGEPAIVVKWGTTFKAADTGRILGVLPSPTPDDPTYKQYLDWHRIVFPQDNATQAAYGMYEIGAFSAMVVAAVGNAPLTGESFGKALYSRFKIGGTKVLFGKEMYTSAFNALALGKNIDFDNFEFDENGEQVTNRLDVFCAVPNEEAPTKTAQYKPAGIYYDNPTKSLKGTLDCSPPAPTP